MFNSLTRQKNFFLLNRFTSVNQKLSYADSLIRYQPRLKDLEVADRKRKILPFKKKFVENLLLNKFDPEILEYPQVSKLKEIEALKKSSVIVKKYLIGEGKSELVPSERAPEKVVSTVKTHELCGFKLPMKSGGFGYLDSEFAYINEALSEDLSLSKTVADNENFGVYLLNAAGSTFQKENYLPKVANGEMLTCFAHSEPLKSLDPFAVNTTAVKSSDGQNYTVSGKKNWVYSATHANLIIFSASIVSENNEKDEQSNPTLFMVDKNLNGITVHEPIKTVGLNGMDVCELSFNNVVVPSVCVLGEVNKGKELLKKTFCLEKLSHSTQCITLMKKLINTTINHCMKNKLYKNYKNERKGYQVLVGGIISKLYALESMTYLISGRMDMFEEADVFLESIILKIFSSESLQYVLDRTLTVVGSEFYSEDSNLEEILRDSHFFIACQEPNDYYKLILSIAGCKHVINYRKEERILQKIKDYMRKENFSFNWSETLGVTLKGYLHKMFEDESARLEASVFCLKETVNYFLKKYGENILFKNEELKLLADLLVKTYAMTAILGRASRSYCLGLKRAEADRAIVHAEVPYMQYEFSQIYSSILEEKFQFQTLEKLGTNLENIKNFEDVYPLFAKSV